MAPNNTLNIWGNEKTMNLNSLILTNIQSSPYFKVNLYELKTYHEVIDEIYYKVQHMEPWEKGSRKTAGQTGMCGGVRGVGAGGIVSSAFCLLYKLFTLRLTRKQVCGLLEHNDSPYIRGLGFMYIRYTQDPKELWEWYEDYLDDEEEIDVKAGGGHVMTIGEMLKQWLTKLEWYSTLFPRIPVPVQKDLEQKLRAVNQARAPPPEPVAPRHIADDEVNFGEAERYASNAASRKRSPTPPHRSQRRSPPRRSPPPRHRSSPAPRQRSPPPHRARSPPHRARSPAHRGRSPPYQRSRSPAPRARSPRRSPPRRSPPRHRHSPPRYRRSRSPRRDRSPKRGASPFDYARELEKERQRQTREKDGHRSSSRERKKDKERKHSPSREKSSKHRSGSKDKYSSSKHRSRSPKEKKSHKRSRSRSRDKDKKKHKKKHRSRSADRHNGRS